MHQYTNVANQNQSMTCMIEPKRHNSSFFFNCDHRYGYPYINTNSKQFIEYSIFNFGTFYMYFCMCVQQISIRMEKIQRAITNTMFFLQPPYRVYSPPSSVMSQTSQTFSGNSTFMYIISSHTNNNNHRKTEKKNQNSFVDRMRNRRVFACSQHEL